MADYAFRTIRERTEIQRLWETGATPKEIAASTGKSLDSVYTELTSGSNTAQNSLSGVCSNRWSGAAGSPPNP